MTVKELVELLSIMDQDKPVFICHPQNSWADELDDIKKVEEESGKVVIW